MIHSHQFAASEVALSLKSCKLGDDPQVYYAVGTAMVNNDESETKLASFTVEYPMLILAYSFTRI